MKEAKVPGLAAAVVKKDKVLWTSAYGWANREQKIPVTNDTLFQVASVSKPVLACAVMQLVEQGKLSLEADVNEILPFYVRNPKHPKIPITLKHLLTHTYSIRDNWNLLEDTWVKNGDFPKSLGESLARQLFGQEPVQGRRLATSKETRARAATSLRGKGLVGARPVGVDEAGYGCKAEELIESPVEGVISVADPQLPLADYAGGVSGLLHERADRLFDGG